MIEKIIISILFIIGIIATSIGTYNLVFFYGEYLGLYFLIPTMIFIKLLMGIWEKDKESDGW